MTSATFTSNKFSALGIRGKLIGLVVALAAVAGICLAVAVSGLLNARTKSHQSQTTFTVFQTARDAYEGWLTDDDQSNMYAATIALKDPRQNQLAETTWQQALAGYRQANAKLAWLSANATDPTVRSMVATLRSDLSSYNAFTQQVGQYGHHGNPVAAVRVVTVTNANISNQTQADFDELSSVLTKEAAAINASVSSNVSSSISLLSVIGIVGLIIAVLITIWLTRSITKPLALMTESAERIAEGDVDVEVEAKSNDEIGRLKHMVDAAGQIAAGNLAVEVEPRSGRDALGRAFSDMREKIAGMVSEISQQSNSVSTASQEMAQSGQQAGLAVGEIANAVGSVAQGAETQVRALERVRGLTGSVATAAQSSAADAEETSASTQQIAASAQELATTAEHLQRMVSQFSL
jgi:methyl-accepting chemotaxis protein